MAAARIKFNTTQVITKNAKEYLFNFYYWSQRVGCLPKALKSLILQNSPDTFRCGALFINFRLHHSPFIIIMYALDILWIWSWNLHSCGCNKSCIFTATVNVTVTWKESGWYHARGHHYNFPEKFIISRYALNIRWIWSWNLHFCSCIKSCIFVVAIATVICKKYM